MTSQLERFVDLNKVFHRYVPKLMILAVDLGFAILAYSTALLITNRFDLSQALRELANCAFASFQRELR